MVCKYRNICKCMEICNTNICKYYAEELPTSVESPKLVVTKTRGRKGKVKKLDYANNKDVTYALRTLKIRENRLTDNQKLALKQYKHHRVKTLSNPARMQIIDVYTESYK